MKLSNIDGLGECWWKKKHVENWAYFTFYLLLLDILCITYPNLIYLKDLGIVSLTLAIRYIIESCPIPRKQPINSVYGTIYLYWVQ